ncbi:MAG: hypothetical protein Q9178_005036 [Gyalolechia marmorata]
MANQLPAGNVTYQILETIRQTFPISQPLVYIQATNQADFDAALARIYNELGILANGAWNGEGEGWMRDQDGNYAYMIQAPPPPSSPVATDSREVEVVETREQRYERISKLREEALQRQAAQPKKARERKPQPEGQVDRRTQQKQRAEERKAKKADYRRSNHGTPRKHQGGKTIPQAPSADLTTTRGQLRKRNEENVGNEGRFYSRSEQSWQGRRGEEIVEWRQHVPSGEVGEDSTEMEDVLDLGLVSMETDGPEDAPFA